MNTNKKYNKINTKEKRERKGRKKERKKKKDSGILSYSSTCDKFPSNTLRIVLS